MSLASYLRGFPAQPSLTGEAWRALVDSAARHGLTALLGEGLANPPSSDIPADVLSVLQRSAFVHTAQAMRQKRDLLALVELLEAEHVPVVALKGIWLAARLWPNSLCRPSTDLDILIPSVALGFVGQLLVKRGFTRLVPELEAEIFENHHHLAFQRGNCLVEVHFRLFTGVGRSALEGVDLARCTTRDFEGRSFRVLPPELELVFLAGHAAQHLFLRLGWLFDLKLLLQATPAMDWREVVAIAKGAGLRSAVHAALLLTHELLGAPVDFMAMAQLEATPLHSPALRRVFTASQLESARLASSPAAGLVRSLLSDSPSRATRHVWHAAKRKVLRGLRLRAGQAQRE